MHESVPIDERKMFIILIGKPTHDGISAVQITTFFEPCDSSGSAEWLLLVLQILQSLFYFSLEQ